MAQPASKRLVTEATLPELARDTIGMTLVAGANVTITPDDAGDTIIIASSSTGGSGASASGALSPASFGAYADTVVITDGAVTSGSTTFSSTSRPLTSSDVGKTIIISSAAPQTAQGSIPAPRFITTVVAGPALAAAPTFTAANLTAWLGHDDTTALQATANAVPVTGGSIHLGTGKYLVPSGTITFPNPTKLVGNGATRDVSAATGTSEIIFGSQTADGLVFQAASSLLEDFGVVHAGLFSTPPTGGRGIRLNRAFSSHTNRVAVVGFYYNLWVDEGYYYNISKCQIHDSVAIGIYLNTPSGEEADHGDQGLDNNVVAFTFSTRSGGTGISWSSGGGIRMVANKINGAEQPVNPYPGKFLTGLELKLTDAVSTSDLMMTGNSIENCTGQAVWIHLSGTSGTGVFRGIAIGGGNEIGYSTRGIVIQAETGSTSQLHCVSITGNVFTGNSGRNIDLINVGQAVVSSNTINRAGGDGIALTGCLDVTVAGNTYDNPNGGGSPLVVDAGTISLHYSPGAVRNANQPYHFKDLDTGVKGYKLSNVPTFSCPIASYTGISNGSATNVWIVGVPTNSVGNIEFAIFGTATGAGGFMHRLTRGWSRGTGAVTFTTVGTDDALSPNGTAVATVTPTDLGNGLIAFAVQLTSGGSGTAVTSGSATVRATGGITSVQQGFGTGMAANPVVTDNGNGTYTATGSNVTDNGDGTFTSTNATDNGNGTFTLAS